MGQIAGAIGASLIGGLLGDSFAGKRVQRGERTVPRSGIGMDAGGFTVDVGDRVRIRPTEQRQELIGGIRDVLGTAAQDLRGFRTDIDSPLARMGELTQQRIADVERRTIGTLRDQLARRRVLGAGFAQDAIARAGAEFARESAEAEAQTALQRVDIETQLIERETALNMQSFNVAMESMNMEAVLGAQFVTDANDLMLRASELRLEAALWRAESIAGVFGTSSGTAAAGIMGG